MPQVPSAFSGSAVMPGAGWTWLADWAASCTE